MLSKRQIKQLLCLDDACNGVRAFVLCAFVNMVSDAYEFRSPTGEIKKHVRR